MDLEMMHNRSCIIMRKLELDSLTQHKKKLKTQEIIEKIDKKRITLEKLLIVSYKN